MRHGLPLWAFFLLAIPLPSQEPAPKADEKKTEAAKPSDPAATAPKPAPAPKKEAKWLAITGGEVWTVSGPNLPGGTVLVKDDKIVQVGAGIKVPDGATVVDARGRHVCPGFVAVAARGALSSRGNTVKEKAKDRFDPFADFMLMSLGSGITTAHEGPGARNELFGDFFGGGGGAFAGTPRGVLGGVVGKLTFGTIEGFELRDPAGVYMNWPANAPAQALEVRDALQKARDHFKKRKEWLDALASGKKDVAEPKADENVAGLARCLAGELPLYMYADDRESIERCLQLSDEFKCPMVIHGAMEAWTVAPEIGRRPVTMIISPRGLGGRGTRPYRDRYVDAPHGWTIENAAHLGRAGIPWATMTLTTSITTTLFGGRDLLGLPLEAAFAVRGGASDLDALRSITLAAAQILKVDDRVGSLDAGKDADILLMDREPLDYRSFVDKAWVNGRLVYERDKVPFWSHIPTDRSKPPGKWGPWGIWGDLTEPPRAEAQPNQSGN